MTITFVGHGYVGLVTAAVFADLGNTVWVIGHTKEKIDNLKKGIIPIFEPGLEEIVKRNVSAGRLIFTLDYDKAIPASEAVFIAVGTPPKPSGEADLSVVFAVAKQVGKYLSGYTVVVTKSTVPVGTNRKVKEILEKEKNAKAIVDIASVPEFLREGQAISDTLHPDRVVLGTDTTKANDLLKELHKPIDGKFVLTTIETAEMIKYAANAFLATKISFANAIASLSELTKADGLKVLEGIGLDKRVGSSFLQPGAGYGGSCFEADETVFSLNSPAVVTERIDKLFDKEKAKKGDSIEYITPSDTHVLAYDLETLTPTIANVGVVTKRPYRGAMVTLKTSMGRSVRVTADHPVILYKEKEVTLLPAAAIVPGDKLMALSTLPDVEPLKSFDLIELLSGTDLAKDVFVTSNEPMFTNLYKQFFSSIPKNILLYPDEIRQHNRISLSLFYFLTEKGVLSVPHEKLLLYTAKGNAAKIQAVIRLNKELLRFLGYYLAEGYISSDKGRKNAIRKRIGITFHEKETEYIKDVQHILQKWGLTYIERNSTHATTTIVSSRILAWFIQEVVRCGTNSENKILPKLVFNVAANLRMELIRGAFSGDGAVTLLQKKRNIMLEYATVSKLLADGMTFLLQTQGVVASVRKRWMNKSTKPAYIIRVSGYGQIALLKNVFGKKHKKHIEKVLSTYKKHIKQRGFERFDHFVTLPVREVLHETVDTAVFSMETSTATLITSSGLISHNCFPKDVKALIAIAKQYGYDFALLKDVEAINKSAMHSIVEKAKSMLMGKVKDKTVSILGLSFKPDTDDMRDAPSIFVINELKKLGAHIKVFDPIAMENAKRILSGIIFAEDAYSAVNQSNLLIVMTEWNEFKQLDLRKMKDLMKTPILIDGRNIYEPQKVRQIGFTYFGVGR